MRKLVVSSVSSLLAILMIVTAVFASVTFDSSTGTGFVGKGDVQLIYGWNNKALNDNAGLVQFRANTVQVSEVSWECTNTKNEVIQERARTTTTAIQGVVTTVAREILKGGKEGAVTGFNLTGYNGDPILSTPVTHGPPVDSCPSGPWTLTSPAGDPVVSSTTTLEVSINGTDWFALQ